jgi:hypothetical protein
VTLVSLVACGFSDPGIIPRGAPRSRTPHGALLPFINVAVKDFLMALSTELEEGKQYLVLDTLVVVKYCRTHFPMPFYL